MSTKEPARPTGRPLRAGAEARDQRPNVAFDADDISQEFAVLVAQAGFFTMLINSMTAFVIGLSLFLVGGTVAAVIQWRKWRAA